MSIKRYDFYDDGRHCRNLTDRVESRTGDFVSFADHLDSLAQVTRERDEFAAICAAVIKNLGIENDDDPKHLPNHAADVSADRVAAWNAWREEASERDEIVNKLYAAERERDEVVEALRPFAGHTGHADHVGALNILAAGQAASACGADTARAPALKQEPAESAA